MRNRITGKKPYAADAQILNTIIQGMPLQNSGSSGTAVHDLIGSMHQVSGLTAGHFLKALSPTTFGFAAHSLTASDVGADPAGTGHTEAAAHVTAHEGAFVHGNIAHGETAYGWGNHAGLYEPTGNLATHAGLTTTAHGLGASAFHADAYFALAAHNQAVSTISDSTTIGQNYVKLTNPSAITFPRMNADNTVSALSASDFRTAIGVGVGDISGTGVAGRVAEFVTDTKTLQAANLIGPAVNILTLTATAASTLALAVGAGKALTLTSVENSGITFPAAGAVLTILTAGAVTAALLESANVFTAAQSIISSTALQLKIGYDADSFMTIDVANTTGIATFNATKDGALAGSFVFTPPVGIGGIPASGSKLNLYGVDFGSSSIRFDNIANSNTDYWHIGVRAPIVGSNRVVIEKNGIIGSGLDITNAGYVGIGTPGPAAKLDVRDGDLFLTDADVAHGITGYSLTTNTYGGFQIDDSAAGGLRVWGIGDTVGQRGLVNLGILGDADPTDSVAAITLAAGKKSGAGIQALGNLETVLKVENWGALLVTVLGSGNVGIGTPAPTISGTGKLHMAADTFRLDTARTPANAAAAGNAGEICWDASYVYVCIANATWRRAAHATW